MSKKRGKRERKQYREMFFYTISLSDFCQSVFTDEWKSERNREREGSERDKKTQEIRAKAGAQEETNETEMR